MGIGVGVPIAAILLGLLTLAKLKPGLLVLPKIFGGSTSPTGATGGEQGMGPTGTSGEAYTEKGITEKMSSTVASTANTMTSPVASGPHHGDPNLYPVVIGAGRHQNEREYRPEIYGSAAVFPGSTNNNKISRKPLSGQHYIEAGRSEMDSPPAATQVGTVSPYSDIGSLSGHYGAHELAGLQRYEMEGDEMRHEAPDGTRR